VGRERSREHEYGGRENGLGRLLFIERREEEKSRGGRKTARHYQNAIDGVSHNSGRYRLEGEGSGGGREGNDCPCRHQLQGGVAASGWPSGAQGLARKEDGWGVGPTRHRERREVEGAVAGPWLLP
jgi:hypothetical protein